jgi:hypothetical protein
MLIGGQAVLLHGRPRLTEDIGGGVDVLMPFQEREEGCHNSATAAFHTSGSPSRTA